MSPESTTGHPATGRPAAWRIGRSCRGPRRTLWRQPVPDI